MTVRGRQILTISQNIYCLAPLLARSISTLDVNPQDVGHPKQESVILCFDDEDGCFAALLKSPVEVIFKAIFEGVGGDRLTITKNKLNLHFFTSSQKVKLKAKGRLPP